MFRFTIIICIFLFSSSLNFNATPPQKGKKQTQKKKAGKKTTKSTIKWKSLSEGLDYAEIKAPVYSRVNDNLITALKINPKFYKFELASSFYKRLSKSRQGRAKIKELLKEKAARH